MLLESSLRRAVEFETEEGRAKAMEQGSLAYLDRTIIITELEDVKVLDRFALRREKKIRRHQEAKEKKREAKRQVRMEKKRAKEKRHREHMAAKLKKDGEEKGDTGNEGREEMRGGNRGGARD